MIGPGRPEDEQITITKSIRVQANAAGSPYAIPLLKLTGSVRVLEQTGVITSINSLANATNIYADLYDGTNVVILTLDGISLSGALVGTLFLKDQVDTQPYSVSVSDECRSNEIISDRNAGRPFTITQKNGADTFLRLHLATNTTIDFTVFVHFKYAPIKYDGSKLEFL